MQFGISSTRIIESYMGLDNNLDMFVQPEGYLDMFVQPEGHLGEGMNPSTILSLCKMKS